MLLYIDPGTGSMLFTILAGVITGAFYAFKKLKLKLSFILNNAGNKNKISEKIPIAIFADNKCYWNMFGPILRELDKRKIKTLYLTSSSDDPCFSETFENVKCKFIGEGNRAFATLNMLNASLLFSTTPGLEVYQWKRSPFTPFYIHIPHAANDITLYRMFGIDYFDMIFLSGEYQVKQIRELEKLRDLPPKELEIVGVPYMDEMKKRLENAEPLFTPPSHPTVVLLAPSWGQSSLFNRFGSRLLDALLATGYHIIIRPHPQSYISEKELIKKLRADYPESAQIEWNRDNDNFETLRRSDILISDFSGIIFDCSLVFDKPVIYSYSGFDKAPYDCCCLKEELWMVSVLPKMGTELTAENLPKLKELIDSSLVDPSYSEGRRSAREETWAYIGESVSKIADSLEKKLKLLQHEENAEKK